MMRRMAIGFMALVLLIALCACGGQLEGAMELDREGKGKRTIAVTLQKTELEQVVTGGIEGVEPVIASAKPEWLLYEREDTEKGYILRFTVPFSDIETYQKRCETLRGKEVSVEMAPAEGAFGEGFLLKEDFTSDDLLNWLRDAMKKEFPSKAKAIDQLTYTKKPTSVSYEGVAAENSGSGAIDIDKRVAHAVDSLTLTTGVEAGVWRREAQLGFTGKTVEGIGERLEAEIKKLVPQGGTLNQEADGDGILYRIAVEAETPEALSAATARMLGAQGAGDGDSKRITSSISGDMPFVKSYVYKESFDASALLPAQDAKFLYRFETDSTLLLSEAGFQGEPGNWHQALTREGGGYTLELPAAGAITLEGAYAYEIQRVSIQTERSGNTATRRVLFTLAADVHRAIGEGLNAYLETRLPIGGTLIDPYRGDTGAWTYGVVYTGEIESLATFMANFSGSSTNTLAREELGRRNLWTRTEQWTEHIDLSRLLKEVTVGEGIEYAQTLGSGRETDMVLLNGARQEASGGAFSVKTASPVFDVVTETLSPDIWFYVGAGVGAILIIVALVLIIRGLAHRRRRDVVKLGPGDVRVVDPGGWNAGQTGLMPLQPGAQDMQMPVAAGPGMAGPGGVGGGYPGGGMPGAEAMAPGGVTTVPGASTAMFGAANVPGGTTLVPPAYTAPGQAGVRAGTRREPPPRRPVRAAAGGVARFFMGLIPRFAQVFVMLALLVWLLPFVAFTMETPEGGGWSWAEQVLGESTTGLLQAASGVSSAQGWWNNLILGGALGENAVTFSGWDLVKGKALDPAMPVAEGVTATRLKWTPVLAAALGLTAITFLMILFWPNRYRVKWLTTILCSGASVGLLWLFRNGLESGWIQPLGAELEARLWLGYPITVLLLIASAALSLIMLLLCRFAHRIEKERWERIIQKENAKGFGRTMGA